MSSEMEHQLSSQILLVEDDRDIMETFKELLEIEGYSVACAYNGKEALSYLRAASAPRLILLDLMMPIMDGFSFRREQKKDSKIADIPVVVMSADGNIEAKRDQLDVLEFIKKPVDIDAILSVVSRYVNGI
jgi:CheY-like chemotaxis protein